MLNGIETIVACGIFSGITGIIGYYAEPVVPSLQQAPKLEYVDIKENSTLLKYDMKDRLCLYKTVYGEARGENDKGQMALASNILNRVDDKRFPSTICAVVKQQKKLGKYQYDAWNPKGPNLAKMNKAYSGEVIKKDAMRVMLNSLKVIRGERVLPENSFNFHPVGYKANWVNGLEKYAEIDNQVFYIGF